MVGKASRVLASSTKKDKSVKAKSSKNTSLALCAGAALLVAASSHAGYVSFTSADRSAGLGDAIDVIAGNGNATAAVVNSENPTGDITDPWVERGSVAGGNSGPGTLVDGVLEITVLSGNWGSGGPLTGTWTITDPNFWSTYDYGAISLNVDDVFGAPDHWIWNLTTGAQSGIWDYSRLNDRGGGLASLKLFIHGERSNTHPVSDAGTTLALMGLSLLGIGLSRRQLAK